MVAVAAEGDERVLGAAPLKAEAAKLFLLVLVGLFVPSPLHTVASRVRIALDERRAALCVVSARAEDVHEVRALRKQVWVAPRCSGSKRMHTDGLLRSSCSRARALARRRRSTRWHSGQNRRGAGGAKGKAQRLQ